MCPSRESSVGIETGAHAYHRALAIDPMSHGLLSTPDQFDRGAAHGLGDSHGLCNGVAMETAAESSAHLRGVQPAGLDRHAGDGGRNAQRLFRSLRRSPDLEAVIAYHSGGIHGLERAMFQIGKDIVGLEGARRLLQRLCRVAVAP